MKIRDAVPGDAGFLAKCIMAGMHFYDFEADVPEQADIFGRLTECEQREDLLYSYRYTRVAEVDGALAGALISYPGEIYKDLRHKTFSELWPDLSDMDAASEMETGPGEYYLDSLAVDSRFRHMGIGRTLLKDGIQKGIGLGYSKITLLADSEMPYLVRLYRSVGFEPDGHRQVFGVDFQRMVYTASADEISAGRIARIQKMEALYNELQEAVSDSKADVIHDLQGSIGLLKRYMDSGLWQKDYEADEAGLLPTDLKRGVLSQDGLWNLLEDLDLHQ